MRSGLSSAAWAACARASVGAAMAATRPAMASTVARRRRAGLKEEAKAGRARGVMKGVSLVSIGRSVIGLEVHGLHDAGPAGNVFAHGLHERFGAVGHGVHAVLQQQLAHLARVHGADDFGAQFLGGGGRRLQRRVVGEPRGGHHVLVAALDEAGQLRHERRALVAAGGQHLHAAGGQHLLRAADGVEVHGHGAAHHVLARGRGTAVGHVHHLQAGRAVEHFAQEVRGRAGAVRAKADLVALRLGPGDELGQRVGGHVLVHGERQLEARGVHQRHEVLDRVVRQVAVGAGEHGHHARGAQQQGVAVGRRGLHGVHGNAAGRARAVVDDERAERIAHLVGNGAGQHVLRAAGGHADEHLDRLAGGEGGGLLLLRERKRCEG
eukprot:Opistho-1_new@83878